MDHSTFTYLMAPGAGFLEFFRSEATPEQVADAVQCYAAGSEREAGAPAPRASRWARPLAPHLDDDELAARDASAAPVQRILAKRSPK